MPSRTGQVATFERWLVGHALELAQTGVDVPAHCAPRRRPGPVHWLGRRALAPWRRWLPRWVWRPLNESFRPRGRCSRVDRASNWRAQRLLSSPHRLCFFWAGVQWAVSAGWWAAELLAGPRAGDSQHMVPWWRGTDSGSAWAPCPCSWPASCSPQVRGGYIPSPSTRASFAWEWIVFGRLAAGAATFTGVALSSRCGHVARGCDWPVAPGRTGAGLLRTGRPGERVHVALITIAMAAMALTLLAAALALGHRLRGGRSLWHRPVVVPGRPGLRGSLIACFHSSAMACGRRWIEVGPIGRCGCWYRSSLSRRSGALLPNNAPLPPVAAVRWLRPSGRRVRRQCWPHTSLGGTAQRCARHAGGCFSARPCGGCWRCW